MHHVGSVWLNSFSREWNNGVTRTLRGDKTNIAAEHWPHVSCYLSYTERRASSGGCTSEDKESSCSIHSINHCANSPS